MEVRIGVVYTPKELTIEVDADADAVVAAVEGALGNGQAMLWLRDKKGRRTGVPVDKLAYVEIDSDDEAKQVGFGRS